MAGGDECCDGTNKTDAVIEISMNHWLVPLDQVEITAVLLAWGVCSHASITTFGTRPHIQCIEVNIRTEFDYTKRHHARQAVQ